MAKTQSKIITETVKPLYAVAGATEVAYEFALGYAAEAQKTATERFNEVQKRVSKLEREPKALQNQALALVNDRLEELTKEAKEAQGKFEARVAELQKEARALPKKVQNEIDETVTDVAKTYADLVDRGEKIVALIRKDGVKAVTAVRKAPSDSSVVRRERAKVAADEPFDSSSPMKDAAKKPAAKKPAAKKATAKTDVEPAAGTTSVVADPAPVTAEKATATPAATPLTVKKATGKRPTA